MHYRYKLQLEEYFTHTVAIREMHYKTMEEAVSRISCLVLNHLL